MPPDLAEQAFRAVALVQKIPHDRRRGGIQLSPPKIIDDFLQQLAGVGHQFGVERQAAFEGVVAEHPLAKTVNGEDGGFVEASGSVG